LPLRKGFITVQPENAHLMVFRRKSGKDSKSAWWRPLAENGAAIHRVAIQPKARLKTDLQGRKLERVAHSGGKLSLISNPGESKPSRCLRSRPPE